MDKRLSTLALALAVLAAGCNHTAKESSSSSSSSASGAITPTPASTPGEAAPTTPNAATTATLPGAPASGHMHKLPSGLQYDDMVVGSGKMAETGMTVSVNYSGWLTDGTPFDSSLQPGRSPLVLQLGAGSVIQGWEEGLRGMRIGGKRKLVIPPDLAYGAAGRPPVIPPSSTLVFDLELVDVK